MEYASGAVAGVMAVFFTNPLDVVKTRLQLQGELKARKQHTVHYKNTFHAFYAIAKNDGFFALQKGLVPAAWFQVFLNGIRLGTYGTLSDWGWTKKANNEVSVIKTIFVSAFAGCLGSYCGSPFYLGVYKGVGLENFPLTHSQLRIEMIKTHLQSRASQEIAVGYQHEHNGTFSALSKIYQKEGIPGLWRGSVASLPRVGVGSAAQLATFSSAKEFLEKYKILKDEESLWNTFAASMVSGVVIALFMSPFDVVQTRLYNQGVDASGRGLLYTGIADCFVKMWKTEGLHGFFKGVFPCYLRIGPHSLLCLTFWDAIKQQTSKFKTEDNFR